MHFNPARDLQREQTKGKQVHNIGIAAVPHLKDGKHWEHILAWAREIKSVIYKQLLCVLDQAFFCRLGSFCSFGAAVSFYMIYHPCVAIHNHWEWCQNVTKTIKKNELQWAYIFNIWHHVNLKWRASFWESSLLHFAHRCTFGIQFVVLWIHEAIWILFFMRHNGDNILQWHGNVFVGGPS